MTTNLSSTPRACCSSVKAWRLSGLRRTSAEALLLEEELRPDVVLVDIRLGDESGFDLARQLSGTVILISTHAQSEYAEEIAASPAAGFIPKAQLSASAVLRLAGAPAIEDASAR